MFDRKRKAYSRNYGFWSEAEQRLLSRSRVAIAGVGGDGFQLGYKLAMMGVRKFSIADPEVFEEENSNRVFGANTTTYGRNKAEVFKEMVLNLHPDAEVRIFTDGINRKNIREFMKGANLVLDESELTHLELGTMIAREARKRNIPDLFVMNIGFASIATSFHPKKGRTFEQMMGIPRNASLDEIAQMKVDFSRVLPYMPVYGDLNSLEAVREGASLPSISQGVDIASALGSTEAFLHLTSKVFNHRRKPTWAPKFRYMDSYTGKSGIISTPRLAYYSGILTTIIRSTIGINPKASYSRRDRRRHAPTR